MAARSLHKCLKGKRYTWKKIENKTIKITNSSSASNSSNNNLERKYSPLPSSNLRIPHGPGDLPQAKGLEHSYIWT
jgi:hypothetical protein